MAYRVTSLTKAGVQRTCRPLYEKHQATPHATFLDTTVTETIYSGMVMRRSGADKVRLCDGATELPLGLSALDKNTDIDDSGDGSDAWAVWTSGGDAEFLVDSPSFDTGQSYVVPTNGTRVFLYAGTAGQLGKLTSAIPAAGAEPVAELLETVSGTRLRVRLLAPGTTKATVA